MKMEYNCFLCDGKEKGCPDYHPKDDECEWKKTAESDLEKIAEGDVTHVTLVNMYKDYRKRMKEE